MVLARMRITNGTRLQPRQPFPTNEFAVSDQHLNSSEGHDAQQCFEKVFAFLGTAKAFCTKVVHLCPEAQATNVCRTPSFLLVLLEIS